MTSKRIDIERIRQQKLASFCQFVLLDLEGYIIESDDTIFSVAPLMQQKVQTFFPLLESIYNAITLLKVKDKPLLFGKVEKPATFLHGVYDFVFSKKEEEGQSYILWEIFDYTPLYEDFRDYQQHRNNIEIQRQRYVLEQQEQEVEDAYPKVKTQETALDKSFITLPQALDMAVNSMNDLSTKDASLIDSLDGVHLNFQKILDELPKKENTNEASQSPKEHQFSIEDILYDGIAYTAQINQVYIHEIKIAEEIPNSVYGNPLDFKRILVGLILNANQCYNDGTFTISIYKGKPLKNKCTIGVKIQAISGEATITNMADVLLRLSIIKQIAELHQGKVDMKAKPTIGATTVCEIPFLKL